MEGEKYGGRAGGRGGGGRIAESSGVFGTVAGDMRTPFVCAARQISMCLSMTWIAGTRARSGPRPLPGACGYARLTVMRDPGDVGSGPIARERNFPGRRGVADCVRQNQVVKAPCDQHELARKQEQAEVFWSYAPQSQGSSSRRRCTEPPPASCDAPQY